jgi:hypothetical protein
LRRLVAGRGVGLILAVVAGWSPTSAIDPKNNFEVGLFLPYVAFDTQAPIRDNKGEDDDIHDSFGYGIGAGYNFPRRNALEFSWYKVASDSEDQHGANHFSIITRYVTIGYRRNWNWAGDVDPFFTAGLGDFYANAKEVDHVSYGGRSYYAGIGLRYSPDRRSSVRVYLQEMYVDLEVEPHRAVNLLAAVGALFYVGALPVSTRPPASSDLTIGGDLSR